ncbi:hypothetical protein LXA43DRAFT_895871, partial [Ganoderma leucocontextum]
ITAAYGFMDYRSQGQTILVIIIDIKKLPPPGQLMLFHLYVALSRSHELLQQKHELALLEEDERLSHLNEETKKWWELLDRGC